MSKNIFSKIFGTKNDRIVKTYAKRAKEINALEKNMKN